MHPTDHWFRQSIFHTSPSQGLTSLYGSHYVYETSFQSSKCRAQCGAHSSQHGLSSGPHSRVFSRHQAQRPHCMSAGPYFQWPLSLSNSQCCLFSSHTGVLTLSFPTPLQPKVEMDSCWQLSPDSTVFLLPGFLPQNNSSFAGKRRGGHTITTKRKQNKERNAKPNQTKQKIKTHHSYPRSLQSKSGPPWHSIWSPWWPNTKLLSGFLCPQYPVSQATPLVILLRLRYFPCPPWL